MIAKCNRNRARAELVYNGSGGGGGVLAKMIIGYRSAPEQNVCPKKEMHESAAAGERNKFKMLCYLKYVWVMDPLGAFFAPLCDRIEFESGVKINFPLFSGCDIYGW